MKYTWTNYTVLIAEDDPLNYRYLQLLFERNSDIKMVWAKDGDQASEMLRTNDDIDLALLDLLLPFKDGITLTREIRSRNSHLPVIIQTANTWNNEEKQCFDAGCNAFFTKPLDMDALLQCMDEHLDAYSARQQELAN